MALIKEPPTENTWSNKTIFPCDWSNDSKATLCYRADYPYDRFYWKQNCQKASRKLALYDTLKNQKYKNTHWVQRLQIVHGHVHCSHQEPEASRGYSDRTFSVFAGHKRRNQQVLWAKLLLSVHLSVKATDTLFNNKKKKKSRVNCNHHTQHFVFDITFGINTTCITATE